jgi:methylglutaconyl-CoA hydratase
MSEALVTRQDFGPVALITLNRPNQRNALSRALVARLRDVLDAVAVDSAIRAVVLTGAGPSFCSGMDLKEATVLENSPEAERETIATMQEFADLIQTLHTLPKPTVAAVNGDALAGGAGLMCACDLAIADEKARVGYPEVKRGLVAAIVVHDLWRQVGDRRTRQLLLSGDVISSNEAREWGMVSEITAGNVIERALAIAQQFAECAPSALAATKHLIDEASSRPRDLRGAAAVSAASRVAAEAREGMRAFVEKRPPSWSLSAPNLGLSTDEEK